MSLKLKTPMSDYHIKPLETYDEALAEFKVLKANALKYGSAVKFLKNVMRIITHIEILEKRLRPKHIKKPKWLLMERKEKWVFIINDNERKQLNYFIIKFKKVSDDPVLLSELIEKIYSISNNLLSDYFKTKVVPSVLFEDVKLQELANYFRQVALY